MVPSEISKSLSSADTILALQINKIANSNKQVSEETGVLLGIE
jgi:hypothetical protein